MKLLRRYIGLCIAFWSIASLPAYGIANWQRIATPHFDILFPPYLAREANRVANTLEHIYEPVGKSLKTYPKRITIILRNQMAVSNAFVTLLPRRTEFFTFPTQDYTLSHTNEWLNLLAIHEFRHVVQYALLNQQFNRFLYTLGGERILGLWTGLNIPAWVYEGDAVGTETALTKGGRGRIPYFGLIYKTNLLEKGEFSYQKQLFGSYKDYIPIDNGVQSYRLGYYLTTHLRRNYGTYVLANILEATTQPNLFHLAVKEATDKSLLEIYEDTNQELKALWKQQLQGLKLTPLTRLNKRDTDSIYTNYFYPQVYGNQLIALKEGLDTPSQFVRLDQQQGEHPILVLSNINEETGFSIAQDKLVWIEFRPDLFWGRRIIYSDIQLYDLKTKKLKTLTPKSRYAAAALSPDGTQIVALESDQAYNHQLVILDSEQGAVLQRLPNPENHYYLTPKFSADGQSIVAIKQFNRQSTITIINPSTGQLRDILPYSTENIGWPVMVGNYVFYNSAYSGIDNIYALDLTTQKRYQVTSSKYGAYYVAMQESDNTLLFNDFTKDGMDVVKIPLDPQQWTPLEKVEIRRVDYYEPLVKQENNPDLLNHIPKHPYPIQPYRAANHLINIHSWEPYIDLSTLNTEDIKNEFIKNIAGFTIYSQNLLGTALLKASYRYNFTDRVSNLSTVFTYTGWYPILTIGGKLNKDYQDLDMGIKFPFSWIKGQYQHHLALTTTAEIHHESKKYNEYNQTYKAYFARKSPKSVKDIKTPWKQELKIVYEHVPYAIKRNQVWQTEARANFPGLYKHHGLSLGASYRYRLSHSSHSRVHKLLSNYAYQSSEQAVNTQVYYTFPLSYPDWGSGIFCYLKRVKNRLFYEGSYSIEQARIVAPQHSFGTELIWEFYLLALPKTFEVGVLWYYNTKNMKFILKPTVDKSPSPMLGFVLRYGK
jgi:hypothetical protein